MNCFLPLARQAVQATLLFSLTAFFQVRATADSPANWLQFRGPGGSAVSAATGLPSTLSESLIAWKQPLPGRGISSPLVVGDRLYLSASSGPDQDRLHILCLRASDGARLWERQFWATGRTMTHPKIGVATCTPCSDGQRIFAAFSSNDVVCLDLDGHLLWMRGLTRDYPNASNSLGMASSPIVVGSTFILPVENDSESFAIGLDARTGANRWKINRPKASNWTSPVLIPSADSHQNRVALMSGSGIDFIDPETGAPTAQFAGGGSTVSSLTLAANTLFVPLKGTTALRWNSSTAQPEAEVAWQNGQMINATTSPVVLNGRVYTLNNAGILKCSSAQDGSKVWQLRTTGPYSATPVASENRLYLISEKGLLQVVDTTAPEGALLSSLDLQDTFIGTPSIGHQSLYLRSDAFLYRISSNAAGH
jgi:outer membrane protein assembly factor BamB